MIERFLSIAAERQYKVNEFGLNIVGWRRFLPHPDHYCDFIAVYFKRTQFEWEERIWPATTRPGISYLRNPINPKGTAILKPGQYVDAYSLGMFRGYLALKQVKPVVVYRDDTRDSKFDELKLDIGLFGIHIHRAGVFSKLVGVSSAGCQVFQKRKDFAEFIRLCEMDSAINGNKFTYTLLEF